MSESEKIDLNHLAAMVRAKRGKKGLRETAQEIGATSAPTLSRIERGKMPDLETFMLVCKWLGVSPDSFSQGTPIQLSSQATAEKHPADQIEVFLRADRTLSPETVDALGKMIRLAFEHAQQGKF